MLPRDLDAMAAVADRVHPGFPEDRAVFAERVSLHPQGCHVLELGAPQGGEEAIAGYVLSHPWRWGEPPALNSLLGVLPPDPTTYYVHDLALLPEGRGQGHAGAMVDHLSALAAKGGLDSLSLVAVNDSKGFWRRLGFEDQRSEALARRLASYGPDAAFMTKRVG
ncbi:GNAT family N-acetyltransferase [Microvirga pudoricolor]|uniref:GNAT family N-acetyltransferase n=1 Tax=Microvirga pudoricolor TaxID=2778729 RepID=UPI0019500EAC|nr:GNAT family N-acetyltransferase [Microvirga pudoricolor]MBM6592405.1 GNAT family N-acetyltransferase [Microvirga pudoricolor]